MNMDLISNISEMSGENASTVKSRIEALSKLIIEFCSDLDSVAIPGFGTFQAVKYAECEVTQTDTNKRFLFPPHIDVEFKSSVLLRKKFVG